MNDIVWYEDRINIEGLPAYHIVSVQGRIRENRVQVCIVMYGGGDLRIETFSTPLEISIQNTSTERLNRQYSNQIYEARNLLKADWLGLLKVLQHYYQQQNGRSVYYDFAQRHWFYDSEAQPSADEPVLIP